MPILTCLNDQPGTSRNFNEQRYYSVAQQAAEGKQVTAIKGLDRMLGLSVIVPTFNRRQRLERLLRGLAATVSAGTELEVVVSVDGSEDGTKEMLEALPRPYTMRILDHPNMGPAAARNRAIDAAMGDVLLFLDDDVIPLPGLVERHLAVHQEEPRAVAIGPMLAPAGQRLSPWLQWEVATLQKQYTAMRLGSYAPTPRQFYTANASVRREHVLAAGGFDERFRRAEDVELACRLADLGLHFRFLPDAGVIHDSDRTLSAWLRMAYDYGHHDVLMAACCGRLSALRLAFQELETRNRLSRTLSRASVGRPRRFRPLIALLSAGIRLSRSNLARRLGLPLCSAAFNLEYWQGIADATGLGPAVWQDGNCIPLFDSAAACARLLENGRGTSVCV